MLGTKKNKQKNAGASSIVVFDLSLKEILSDHSTVAQTSILLRYCGYLSQHKGETRLCTRDIFVLGDLFPVCRRLIRTRRIRAVRPAAQSNEDDPQTVKTS